jgi:hypothetical protein
MHSQMNTDCVMLILEHACKKKVHAKADWLHATTGMSRHPCSKMGSTFVETLQDGEFMRGEGFIKSERTIVLRDTIQAPIINASTFCSSVWTGHISKKNARADAYDLALVDGDGAEDLYEEQRSEDDERERVSGRYKRDPCVGWGRREVRFYTIALSHDIRVSVSFDVVVVPTSWWMDDLEHYWFVIQLLSGKRSSDQTISCDKKGYSRTYMGIDMIGWQSRILEVI